MRHLVFSDSHLTHRYDAGKFEALREAIEHADSVVINGDFWDGFSTTFDKFVSSEWSRSLFPLLKKKKAIYIFGNHDHRSYSDSRASLFSVKQLDSFDLVSGEYVFHMEHGNKLIKLIDEWINVRMPPFVNNAYEAYEGLMVKLWGKKYLERAYARFNKVAVDRSSHSDTPKKYLVIGHTHLATLNHNARFINTGFIKHGLAQYIYIEDGRVTVVEKWY